MATTSKALLRYSRSIFREETPLMILAWLERSGDAKEEDLATSLGKELDHIKRCLVDLHENGFVAYREETIRITEAGKEVLDRLGLSEKVIESVLSTLQVPDHYRGAMEHLLNQYRDSAYEYYLDTQSSVYWYNAFHHSCHFSTALTQPSKEFQSVES